MVLSINSIMPYYYIVGVGVCAAPTPKYTHRNGVITIGVE